MRFSWAVNGLGGFVICRQATKDMCEFPFGICCPINGASRWELIEILEQQNESK